MFASSETVRRISVRIAGALAILAGVLIALPAKAMAASPVAGSYYVLFGKDFGGTNLVWLNKDGKSITRYDGSGFPLVTFVAQNDGNTVVYLGGVPPNGSVAWDTGTHGTGYKWVFQADGNIVEYTAGNVALWHSCAIADGPWNYELVAQTDGNVVEYFGPTTNPLANWTGIGWSVYNNPNADKKYCVPGS